GDGTGTAQPGTVTTDGGAVLRPGDVRVRAETVHEGLLVGVDGPGRAARPDSPGEVRLAGREPVRTVDAGGRRQVGARRRRRGTRRLCRQHLPRCGVPRAAVGGSRRHAAQFFLATATETVGFHARAGFGRAVLVPC